MDELPVLIKLSRLMKIYMSVKQQRKDTSMTTGILETYARKMAKGFTFKSHLEMLAW